MSVCVAVVGHQVSRSTLVLFIIYTYNLDIHFDVVDHNRILISFNCEQNNPLYIQSFTDADDALKLHHIVHCSLDVIDERGAYIILSSTLLIVSCFI